MSKEITQAIDAVALMEDVYTFIGRFVSYPSHEAQVAHTLWIAHTHLMDVWTTTPRIAFLSAEPESGKTRALEVTDLLVPSPVMAFNASPSYIFRKVSDPKGLPTILFDEVDTVFGEKAKPNEELRGLINAGHRRGSTVGRCTVRGDAVVTEDFPAYCALAVAGIGNLPDTILTRSIIVRMRKRRRDEVVETFRQRLVEPEGKALRERLVAWAETCKEGLRDALPEMPEGVEDRSADNWEALLAVADAVGGHWPETARVSAVSLVSQYKRDGGGSLGIRLLSDLRLLLSEDEENVFTSTLLDRLHNLEEAPWSSIKGQPLSDRLLASLLSKYEVRSKQVRVGDVTRKGYAKSDLVDVWERYLPSPLPSSEEGKHGKQGKQTHIIPMTTAQECSEEMTLRAMVDRFTPEEWRRMMESE